VVTEDEKEAAEWTHNLIGVDALRVANERLNHGDGGTESPACITSTSTCLCNTCRRAFAQHTSIVSFVALKLGLFTSGLFHGIGLGFVLLRGGLVGLLAAVRRFRPA
jgi:hypothetical protein